MDSHANDGEPMSGSNNDGDDDLKAVPKTFLESLHLSSKHEHELFHVPHTFFYLSKANQNTRAYDLQLISQEAIDKHQYYTISKEGLTLHRGSDSEFTSLSQWEREYSLFHQISVIPFFRQYRRWKVRTYQMFVMHVFGAFYFIFILLTLIHCV